MQTFSTIPQVSFLFYWWFPLPCRSLLVSCSSTCLFCLCFWNQISPSLQKKKKIAKSNIKGLYCSVYFYFFGFRSFTVKSFLHVIFFFFFWVGFCVWSSSFIVLHEMSNILETFHWKDYPFFIVYSLSTLFLKVFFFLLDREFSTILRLSFWR